MSEDRLTKEERNLIEAAERWASRREGTKQCSSEEGDLEWAAKRYRESQQKWRENPLGGDGIIGPHGRIVFVHEDSYRHIILALLNAGEKALAEQKDGTR